MTSETCWFCGRRPSDPAVAVVVAAEADLRVSDGPHASRIEHTKLSDIEVPRCRACRRWQKLCRSLESVFGLLLIVIWPAVLAVSFVVVHAPEPAHRGHAKPSGQRSCARYLRQAASVENLASSSASVRG